MNCAAPIRSYHPKESGLFRYRTRHEAAHARELMARNNPTSKPGDIVESPQEPNMVFACPNKGRPGKCPADKDA